MPAICLNSVGRHAREGLAKLSAAAQSLSDQFTAGIRPSTVRTLGLLAGSEQLQFRLGKRVEFRWEGDTGRFHARSLGFSDGHMVLWHPTLGLDAAARGTLTGGAGAGGREWVLPEFVSGTLDAAKSYYLYAVCFKWADYQAYNRLELSEQAAGLDNGLAYFLLVGVLSSADGRGDRGFTPAYGYTEVLPGMIRTDLISSNDGKTYFDIAAGEIGGNIRFKGTADYQELEDHYNALAFLKRGFTDVAGGLIRTFGVEMMQGDPARVTAGLYGGGDTGAYGMSDPAFWAGGTRADAGRSDRLDEVRASTVLFHDGAAKLGPMRLSEGGDMTWVDGGLELTPRRDLPALSSLLADAPPMDDTANVTRTYRSTDPTPAADYLFLGNGFYPILRYFKVHTVRATVRIRIEWGIVSDLEFNPADPSAPTVVHSLYVNPEQFRICELYFRFFRHSSTYRMDLYSRAYAAVRVDYDREVKKYPNQVAPSGFTTDFHATLNLHGWAATYDWDVAANDKSMTLTCPAGNYEVESWEVDLEYRRQFSHLSKPRFIIGRNGVCVFCNSDTYLYVTSDGKSYIKGVHGAAAENP